MNDKVDPKSKGGTEIFQAVPDIESGALSGDDGPSSSNAGLRANFRPTSPIRILGGFRENRSHPMLLPSKQSAGEYPGRFLTA